MSDSLENLTVILSIIWQMQKGETVSKQAAHIFYKEKCYHI